MSVSERSRRIEKMPSGGEGQISNSPPAQNNPRKGVNVGVNNRELLKLADEKFDHEEGWEEGYWIDVDYKRNYIRVYHRFFPLKPFMNQGLHSYHITLKRKYAYIEHTYAGLGWNQPFQVWDTVKVNKADVMKIIQEAKSTEELYEKIKELYENARMRW